MFLNRKKYLSVDIRKSNKRRFTFICTFVTILLVAAVSIHPQNKIKEFEKYISDFQKNKNIPSISAGISHQNNILWTDAKGYADVENFVPATKKTVYRIASISKILTAVAIMQLVEQKKIALDDNALRYIPFFPTKKWKFTIRQLLNHTAGIRNYRTGEFDSKENYTSTKEALSIIISDTLEYEPGTKHLYTTLGYNLLAAVIENVSGISYTEYMQKYIFSPSGMSSTFFEYQKDIIYYRAKGYTKNSLRRLQNSALADLSIKFAGGGIISTSNDLLKFAINLLDGKLISSALLDTMKTKTTLKDGKKINYGLGFSLAVDPYGTEYLYHSGNGTGFTSQLVFYQKEKVAAVHLINCNDRDLGSPSLDLVKLYLEHDKPKPMIPASDHLMTILLNYGIDSTLVELKIIQKDTLSNIIINADEMVQFGDDLLNSKKYRDAIVIFKSVINDFPDYYRGYVGLGDAYLKDGNKGLALRNYRQALKLNPKNTYVTSMIKKIEGG